MRRHAARLQSGVETRGKPGEVGDEDRAGDEVETEGGEEAGRRRVLVRTGLRGVLGSEAETR